MPKDAHLKAAEHHDNAAKAHRTAAEHHGKGDHAKGMEHSKSALDHSVKAHEASKHAHEKSSEHKSSSVRAFKNGPSKRRAFCFSGPRSATGKRLQTTMKTDINTSAHK